MNTELIKFIEDKILRTKQSIESREQSIDVLVNGTEGEWSAAAKVNNCKPMTKTERFASSVSQRRICHLLQHDLKMFESILKKLKEEK